MSKIHRKLQNAKHGGGDKRTGCILTGLIAAAGMLAILITVFAYLMNKGYVPVTKAGLSGKVCLAAASLLGCYLAAKQAERRSLLYSGRMILHSLQSFILMRTVSMMYALLPWILNTVRRIHSVAFRSFRQMSLRTGFLRLNMPCSLPLHIPA